MLEIIEISNGHVTVAWWFLILWCFGFFLYLLSK